jgi:hypothetical protein
MENLAIYGGVGVRPTVNRMDWTTVKGRTHLACVAREMLERLAAHGSTHSKSRASYNG